MAQTPIPKLLSFRELSEQSNVPRSTWYSLAARGEIAVVRIGRSIRITEQDAAAYIAANREQQQ